MKNKILLCLCAYVLFLLLLAPFVFPVWDSFYYWEWGQHLGLSYLDGPPVIAYMMSLSALLFGTHLFSINVVGVACAAGTAYFIYQTGHLSGDKRIGLLAALIWILSPTVMRNLITRVTYDSPENLFWASSMFFAASFLLSERTSQLYKLAISLGLLLLSKYTGLILVLCLLLYFLSCKKTRGCFKSIHFYLAGLLVIAISSPVLIWNLQHGWISFRFQLNQHGESPVLSFQDHLENIGHYLWRMLYTLNVLLIVPLMSLFKRPKSVPKTKALERFLAYLSIGFLAFWLIVAYRSPSQLNVRINYFTPAILTLSLLTSCFLVQHLYLKASALLCLLSFLVSLGMLLACTVWAAPYFSGGYLFYLSMQKMAHTEPAKAMPVLFLGDWVADSVINFNLQKAMPLPSCTQNTGQYRYWSNAHLDSAQYLVIKRDGDFNHCIRPLFKTCNLDTNLSANGPTVFICNTSHPSKPY